MELKPTNRRRSLIVNESEQRRLILSVALVPTLVVAAAASGVAVLGQQLETEAALDGKSLQALNRLLIWAYGFVAVFGVGLIRQAIVVSHRVSGSARQITSVLRRVCEGDLDGHVTLRQHDFNTEIADGVNDLIEHLREERGVESPHLAESAHAHPAEIHAAELHAAETQVADTQAAGTEAAENQPAD